MDSIEQVSSKTTNQDLRNLENLLDSHLVQNSVTGEFPLNGQNVKIRFVRVTPYLANYILENHNRRNRPMSAINLEFLKEEMKDNRWEFNGEAISFNISGTLNNGQHRLTAVSTTGCSQIFLVVTNISDDSFSTIDMGRKRAGSDILAMYGVKNSTAASAVVKSIYAFRNEKFSLNRNMTRNLSNTELKEYYDSLPNLDSHIDFSTSLYKQSNKFLTANVIGTFSYLISEKYGEKSAIDFLSKLCKGVGVEEDSPIYILRSKLLKTKTEKFMAITNLELYRHICYYWQKYKSGVKMKRYSTIPEDYIPSID